MPKMQPPDDATELWKWMDHWNVPVQSFAATLEITPQHLSDVRRGKRRPSDELKRKIETATLAYERQHRVKHPRGVKILTWYSREVAAS
jgi:predicted transcriptional regulator